MKPIEKMTYDTLWLRELNSMSGEVIAKDPKHFFSNDKFVHNKICKDVFTMENNTPEIASDFVTKKEKLRSN